MSPFDSQSESLLRKSILNPGSENKLNNGELEMKLELKSEEEMVYKSTNSTHRVLIARVSARFKI